jgi:CRISPR-associated protein Cas2
MITVLVTYDIKTDTPAGKRNLNRLAKKMLGFGTRVQASVWECLLNIAELEEMKREIEQIIKEGEGNVRVYQLTKDYKKKITQIRGEPPKRMDEPILI